VRRFCTPGGLRFLTLRSWTGIACVLIASSLSLRAQLWVNGGGAGNVKWSRTDNWAPNGAPANDGSANLVFGPVAKPQGYAPDMDANWNVNSVTFASSNTNSYALHSLSGFTLTLQGGITNNSTLVQTVSNSIVLGANQTWNAAAGDLAIAGNVDNNGHALSVGGAHDTTFTGIISGSGGLTKNDSGMLSLLANDTFSGPVTINGGTLNAGAAGALGSVSSVTINGGSLSLAGLGNRVNDFAPILLNGGGIWGNNLSEAFGPLTVSASSSINLSPGGAAGTITFASAQWTAGTLTINGWSGAAHTAGTDDRVLVSIRPADNFLANVQFAGFPMGSEYLLSGELVPVPEPKPMLLCFCTFALASLRYLNRVRKRASARRLLDFEA